MLTEAVYTWSNAAGKPREPEPEEDSAAIGEGNDLKQDVDRWSHFTDDSSQDRVELDGPFSTFSMSPVENRAQNEDKEENEEAGPM